MSDWVRDELQAAGRQGKVVVFALLSLDRDSSAALAAVSSDLARWARSGVVTHVVSLAGIDDTDNSPLDDATVRSMTVAGNAGECAEALNRWEASGVDSLVLIPRSMDGREQVEQFAAEVLPCWRAELARGSSHATHRA